MRNVLLIILFSVFIQVAFGQGEKPIITQLENDFWIDSLENSPIAIQIEMIKNRIIQDTAVYYPGMTVPTGILRDKIIYVPQNYVAGLDYADLVQDTFQINGFKGDSRLFVACRLYDNKNKYDFIQIKRDNTTKISTIIDILQMLSTENIAGIDIIKRTDEESVLFGSSYGFGVIILDLINKKDYKQIEKLNK